MKAAQFSDNLRAQAGLSKLFQGLFFSSILLNSILALALASLAQRAEKTVFVPPEIHKTFWVDGEHVDPAYLEQMGLFVIQNYATYTPLSKSYQDGVLLNLVDPAAYPDLSVRLKQSELRIKGQNLTQIFHPISVQVNVNTFSVAVIGNQDRHIVDKRLGGSMRKAYLVQFRYRNGKVTILSLKETSPVRPFEDLPVKGTPQPEVEESSMLDAQEVIPDDMPPSPPPPPSAEEENDFQKEAS